MGIEAGAPLNELLAQLEALPGIELRETSSETLFRNIRVDRLIRAEIKGRPVLIAVEVKAAGYPRNVREAIWSIGHLRGEEDGATVIPLLAAPHISASSRELLREHGIGYWDHGGSLYLEAPQALFLIERPPAVRPARRLANVFRGSTAQVHHALLRHHERDWHVQDLADLAEVAPSTVHQVFTHLEAQLWMERTGKGPATVRRLVNPGALLDAWAEHYAGAINYAVKRYHRWAQTGEDLLRLATSAFDEQEIKYALTLGVAAERIAPYATDPGTPTLLVQAEDAFGKLPLQSRGFRQVNGGETLTVLASVDRSPLLFRQRVDDLWIASDIQLYLDLWAWPQRGKEQALHLRQQRLPY